jgi:hypothetical protein
MASVTPNTVNASIVAPGLSRDQLLQILLPEPGERVIFVPQCSYHLVDVADHGGMVGLPAMAIEPLLSPMYGSPSWHTWTGRYVHRGHDHELPIGYAMLLIRDGILRRGPQNWDSGD